MQNPSSIGYKSFASKFQDHSSQDNQYRTFQQRAFAIKKNKLELLHSLCLQKSFSIQQKNEKQSSLLHYTAYFNSATCALYLLYKNADINAIDKQGTSVFHLCCYTGHVQVLRYILQYWKITRIKSLNQKFIQILAKTGFKRTDSKKGKLKIQVSTQRTNKFNKGQQQITRLYAQYRRQYSEFILKNYEKSDVTFNRNTFHYTALNKYQKCYATLQYMVESLHNQDLNLSYQLMLSLNQVSALIDNYVDPRQFQDTLAIITDFILPQKLKEISNEQNLNIRQHLSKILESKDKQSHTPMYLASKVGAAAIVALIKKLQKKYLHTNADITHTNDDIIKIALNNSSRNQITDLCEASKNADVQIINFLISCGEQVNKKKTIFGTFALLQAIRAFQKQKNIEPIKILLKSGADVNQQDTNGWTIFHHIAQKGLVQILMQVFKQRDNKKIGKLNINKATNKGYHALHIAAMNNKTQIVQIMLEKQNVKKYEIQTNPLDEQKATILHYAAKKGCLKTMKKILQLKGKTLIGAKDVSDNTCLHLAAANNHIQCIKQLIYFDSDYDSIIKVKNKKGKLAKDLTLKKKCFDSIFTAARQGDVNMIRNLINQNPQIKDAVTPIKKRSPLILSVLQLKLVNVKFLVDQKADQYTQDVDGKSASQYAHQLQQYYAKHDKKKLPLIKQIQSLLD